MNADQDPTDLVLYGELGPTELFYVISRFQRLGTKEPLPNYSSNQHYCLVIE